MAKKQDAYYFDTFVSCVDCACNAAKILNDTLTSFDAGSLKVQLSVIHAEEHAADSKEHELLEALAKAFITPIEREDILQLSQNIDEMVDKIEDVLMRVYCNNITVIRPDALEMSKILMECCHEVRALMVEFADFKHSKHLREHVIAINSLEEKADAQYMECLHNLHTNSKDAIEIIAWHEVYTFLEQCIDACEHAADVVESVVMKNT